MKLLLVEDQSGMAQSLKQGLEENNIQVDIANDGKIGKELFEQNGYDVIVLDVMMPEISGLELCSYIRSIGNSVPILIISALDNVEDKVIGFEVGGDDYLTKPFAFSEFLARIKALDRRNHAQKNVSRLLNIHDLHINFDNKTIQRNQINIELTPKEFRLLEYFIKNEGRVLPKQEISENVWDVDFDTGTNVVEVYVNYLRNKLDKGFDKKLIHTKFGVGYVFNPQ